MLQQLGLPLALVALCVTSGADSARSQAAAEAGPSQSVAHPAPATLQGQILNPTALEWWTSDGNNATEDHLLKWLNAATTSVGPLQDAIGGLYGYPTDLVEIGGVMYGVDATRRQLYTLNTSTGLVTPVGAPFSTNWANVHGLAWDDAGQRLFAIDLVRKQILRIAPTTGVVTTVGFSTLAGLTGLRSLAYRASDDRLYAVDFNSGQLLRVHPTTGAIVQSVAMAPNPGARVEELAFHGGRLYGTNGLLSAGFLTAGQLIEIDPDSGAWTALGGVLNDCSAHSLVVKGIPETFEWSQLSGPGVASFVNPHALDTQVSFSAPGVYALRLTVFTLSGPVDDVVEVISDACPGDPNKVLPGACGCGVADLDSDGDGALDCFDGCPADPAKLEPGACGCGVADLDSDGDATPDCLDGCPLDPAKLEPGLCGCGAPDVDDDGDGVVNCLEQCPADPLKLDPGACGCGVADVDSDGDGALDCLESCPNDPLKLEPGLCGCGVSEADSDLDGLVDCLDNCPALSNPTQDDGDGDTVGDACDNCPLHPNATQLDCDGDLAGDVCEIESGAELDLNFNGVPDSCEGPSGTPFCFGDGTGAACPCSNPGAAGRGCANSTGVGSRLVNLGGVSCALDDALLSASDLPLNRPGIFYMGTEMKNGGAGAPFGAGLRCLSGQLKRFGVQNSGASGSMQRAGIVALSNGLITPGSNWYFQVWHRDSLAGCSKQFNLSNGWWITFTP